MSAQPTNPAGILTAFTGFPPSGHMHCPQCNYALSGLPAEHNCPECGFRYDADTHVWIIRTSRLEWVSNFLTIGVNLLIPMGFVFMRVQTGNPRFTLLVWLGLINFAMAVLHIVVWFRKRRHPRIACVGPGGILHGRSNLSNKTIPIEVIRDIELQKELIHHSIRLQRNDKAGPTIIGVFTNDRQRREFVRVVKDRLARRANSS